MLLQDLGLQTRDKKVIKMKLLLIFCFTCIGATFLSADDLYIVGTYGKIEMYDPAFKLLKSTKIPKTFGGPNKITDADIAKDGKVLFLATRLENTPLLMVDAQTLEVMKATFQFPPKGLGCYLPEHIKVTSKKYLYIMDETYTACVPPFDRVRVDLETNNALCPLAGPFLIEGLV